MKISTLKELNINLNLMQKLAIINESGLYSLITQSRKLIAKLFDLNLSIISIFTLLAFLGCNNKDKIQIPVQKQLEKKISQNSVKIISASPKGDIFGIGYGKTIEETKKNALSSLSSKISTNIRSEYISKESLINFKAFSKKIHNIQVISETPLIGTYFSEPIKSENGFSITAFLLKKDSNPKYLLKIKKLYSQLKRDFQKSKGYQKEKRVLYLKETLKNYNNLQKYLSVAHYLNVKNLPKNEISMADIKSEIADSELDFTIKKKIGKFYANLELNKDKEIFKSGEEIEILAQLSQKGCFMIVGYTKNIENFSYLLELSNDSGIDKFIMCVDKNERISLGKFIVKPPFGKEYLDIIASKSRFKKNDFKRINPKYDEDSELYIIGDKNTESLVESFEETRALAKKRNFQIDSLKFKTIK